MRCTLKMANPSLNGKGFSGVEPISPTPLSSIFSFLSSFWRETSSSDEVFCHFAY